MKYFLGSDVSLDETAVCAASEEGVIISARLLEGDDEVVVGARHGRAQSLSASG
jgi:hypothetical protein